jgi:hypothetical protein
LEVDRLEVDRFVADNLFDVDRLEVDNLFDVIRFDDVSSSNNAAVVFPVKSDGARRAENDPKSFAGSILVETFLSLMLAFTTGTLLSSEKGFFS